MSQTGRSSVSGTIYFGGYKRFNNPRFQDNVQCVRGAEMLHSGNQSARSVFKSAKSSLYDFSPQFAIV